MSITNAARRFEQRFDAKAERLLVLYGFKLSQIAIGTRNPL